MPKSIVQVLCSKQKLSLCTALIHKPRLLLLDEPTTGVDPASRKEFWDMLLKLQKRGITIIVSTPYLDEASLCNKLALMHKSKIIAHGNTSDFIRDFPRQLFHIKASDNRKLIQQLRDFPSCHSAFSFGDSIHYQDERDSKDMLKGDLLCPPYQAPLSKKGDLLGYLENLGQSNISIIEEKPTIEDAFIEYLQGENNDD